MSGSVHVARSVLEWRADPTSEWHDASLAGKRLLLICAEGYSSSLAAASLVQLGVDAGDLEGGFDGWVEAGVDRDDARVAVHVLKLVKG